jgi:multiple sugar transport system permease protein
MAARRAPRRGHRSLIGYLYISPWLVGFLIFLAGPLLASLWLSFTDYTVPGTPSFVGLSNYRYMISGDPLFWGAVGKSAYFAALVVGVGLAGSLACALLLDGRLRGAALYRTAFFIPTLTPPVATALIWSWLLQPRYGPVNGLLHGFGLPEPGWLRSPGWAVPSVAAIRLWATVGGAQMFVFLAGLQAIPRELHDAARVDGAGAWQRFRHVTLPMLSPTILFNLVVGIIGALKVFAIAYVATGGGPADATWFYILHLYQQAFGNLELGYASALAWGFCVAVLALTLLQFRLFRRRLQYG